jgi:hypothetical protein
MRWDFNGSSNYPTSVYDSFPTSVPVCYIPEWNIPGTYLIDIYYNGWLTAYPNSDCYTYGPSHWEIKVIVQPVLSVPDTRIETDLLIYPNPTEGIVNCQFVNGNTGLIEVYNMLGERIFVSGTEPRISSIDLRLYPNGLYFIKLCTETGTIVKKLIKN